MSVIKQNLLKILQEKLLQANEKLDDNKQEEKEKEIEEMTEDCKYCHAKYHPILLRSLQEKITNFLSSCEDLNIRENIINQSLNQGEKTCSSKEVLSFDNKPCTDDVTWEFVCLCLKILLFFSDLAHTHEQNNIKTTEPCPNFFGVNDEKTILALFDYVIMFGISQNLPGGIGLRYEKKVAVLPPSTSNSIHPRKLFIIMKVLVQILHQKSINSIIFPRISTDLIAALLFLRYVPRKKSPQSCSICEKQNGVEYCCKILCESEKLWCENQLNEHLEKTYQPLLVRDLLRLQQCCAMSGQKSNGWFLRKIGQLLSKCLTRKNGVKMVIQGILDGMQTDTMTWQKYEAIGKVIARVPSHISDANKYYNVVCPQITDFLMAENIYLIKKKQTSKQSHFFQVSIATIKEMVALNYDAVKINLFEKLWKPLNSLLSGDTSCVIINEDELFKTITCLHMLCTNTYVNGCIVPIISSILHPLFMLLCVIKRQSLERKLTIEILIHTLSSITKEISISLIIGFIFQNPSNAITQHLPVVNLQLCIKFVNKDTEDGFTSHSLSETPVEQRIGLVLEVLNDKRFEEIRGVIFLDLLERLSNIQSNKTGQKNEEQQDSTKDLLHLDNIVNELKFNIELVSFMSAMLDCFGSSLLQDTPQIICFMKNTLERSALVSSSSDEFLEDSAHAQTVDMALMLLSTLLATEKLTSADFLLLGTLTPSLENVSKTHQNESSCRMANDLKVFISTRGAVKPEENKSDSPVIVEVVEITVGYTLEERHFRVLHSEMSLLQGDNQPLFRPLPLFLDEKRTYEQALKDITDPLLPTRGHGLIKLANLLQQRNPYALNEHAKLLEIFETNLSHSDSYLYLSAIDGLVALSDRHHKIILPLLCQKFALFHEEALGRASSEVRLKLSEAIIKICQLCNEILPRYKEIVISALLTGVKDHESSVRASSLSAVGEVCKLLKYSIGFVMDEIFLCVYHVLQSDQSKEVRRSAVQMFALLFKGLDDSVLQTLEHNLHDIYRLLKSIYETDDDDVTKHHAENAIIILNEILKESFMKNAMKLEKKIEILPTL